MKNILAVLTLVVGFSSSAFADSYYSVADAQVGIHASSAGQMIQVVDTGGFAPHVIDAKGTEFTLKGADPINVLANAFCDLSYQWQLSQVESYSAVLCIAK